MKTKVFILIVTFTLAIFACKSEKEKEALNTLGDLTEQNKATEDMLNGEILDSVLAYQDSLDQLHADITGKKIDKFPENQDQNLVTAYHATSNAEKILGHYTNRYLDKFNEKIEASNAQLEDLRHDIDKGLLEDSLINEYISKEDSVVQMLHRGAKSQISFARQQFTAYGNNKEKVKEFIKSLEAENSLDE
ncbi:MAG: hypothetical protein ACLFM1_05640 [Bacteroidales bacterium]